MTVNTLEKHPWFSPPLSSAPPQPPTALVERMAGEWWREENKLMSVFTVSVFYWNGTVENYFVIWKFLANTYKDVPESELKLKFTVYEFQKLGILIQSSLKGIWWPCLSLVDSKPPLQKAQGLGDGTYVWNSRWKGTKQGRSQQRCMNKCSPLNALNVKFLKTFWDFLYPPTKCKACF